MADHANDRRTPDHEPPDAEEHGPYGGPYETGPLGEPIEEPIPQGTLILLALFLIVLVILWLLAFIAIWNRGLS
ncbi:MAG: hypothetical protein QJR03_15210 [Sphaerobacter sp.]|nr:hypothetical protein [Sphaerobacter sp.]